MAEVPKKVFLTLKSSRKGKGKKDDSKDDFEGIGPSGDSPQGGESGQGGERMSVRMGAMRTDEDRAAYERACRTRRLQNLRQLGLWPNEKDPFAYVSHNPTLLSTLLIHCLLYSKTDPLEATLAAIWDKFLVSIHIKDVIRI
jgi:hypothetical protein